MTNDVQETESVVPTNATGPAVANIDPLMNLNPLKRGTPGMSANLSGKRIRKLRDILKGDSRNERRTDRG